MTNANLRLVLLAGPSCAGKSTLADHLEQLKGAEVIRAWELIAAVVGSASTRSKLQELGARIEHQTGGRWLADAVDRHIRSSSASLIVVDSIRTPRQATSVLQLSPTSLLIYLTADVEQRDSRFRARHDHGYQDAATLAAVEAHPTERAAMSLQALAHSTIDTTRLSVTAVYEAAVACLEEASSRLDK